VKFGRHMSRVIDKIRVGREDWQVESVGDGADEEVDATSRYAMCSALVVEARGLLVVGCEDGYVVEVCQSLPQPLEVSVQTNSGKDFLTDRADDSHSSVADQRSPLFNEPKLVRIQVV
jgi:hypothetical protein